MLRTLILSLCLPCVLFAETKIVLIGDSNTYGVPMREHGWAHFLKCDLLQSGYDVKIFNYAVGLATTDQCNQILDFALEAHEPDIVIYTAGLVDVLFHHPLDKMQKNMEASIIKCLNHQAVVIFGVIDFTCWEHKYQYDLVYLLQSNSVFLNIAYKCPVFAFEYLNSQVLGIDMYNLGDWIHPNMEGSRIIYSRVKDKVLEVFANLHIKPNVVD